MMNGQMRNSKGMEMDGQHMGYIMDLLFTTIFVVISAPFHSLLSRF